MNLRNFDTCAHRDTQTDAHTKHAKSKNQKKKIEKLGIYERFPGTYAANHLNRNKISFHLKIHTQMNQSIIFTNFKMKVHFYCYKNDNDQHLTKTQQFGFLPQKTKIQCILFFFYGVICVLLWGIFGF